MSAVNRAGLWFTLVGAGALAGIFAHYDAEHSAPASTVIFACFCLVVGLVALVHEPKK